MKTTEADYPSRAVEATRRVLLELARVLGEYGDHIVLVGGWVPELLAPGVGHVGSTDVDLARRDGPPASDGAVGGKGGGKAQSTHDV